MSQKSGPSSDRPVTPINTTQETSDRNYLIRDIKILWGRAAGRCAFPSCRIEVIQEATSKDRDAIFGKIAHIVAHSPKGPRADANFPNEKRDKYENLLLLCGNHHDIVDKQENTYTTDDLKDWKSTHESWVRNSLAQEIPKIGFAELEIVAKAIQSHPITPNTTYTVTPPLEKMRKNELTEEIDFYMTHGLLKSPEVENFIQAMSELDNKYPERLKAGFIGKYNQFRAEGLTGDALFEAMRDFSNGNATSFKGQAAGLAVLCYMFEKCEVFEP